jgi:3-oxoacyl-[acyl-carrier protein] reductase
MELGLRGRCALVCAGSRGIGRACAEALAAEGARVAICARGEEGLGEAVRAIGSRTGNEPLPIRADLAAADDVDALFSEVARAFGTLHILVTNAGGPPQGGFSDTSDADWQQAFELTFQSAARCIRHALPWMTGQGYGRIVQLASFSVKQPIDSLIRSNAMRSAVTAMGKTLSREVAGAGVTVNTVCPGYVLTDRLRALFGKRALETGMPVEEAVAEGLAEIPAGRFGEPGELGALVAFLASDRAAYITGTTLQVDGGLVRSLL